MGEDLAPNLGGTKKVFSRPNFRKNVHFAGYKFLMTLFLVIDLVLRIFPFFSHIFRIFTMLNVVYDHFLTRKPSFFTLFILSRTSDKTTSQNIGGTNAWAVPPTSNFGGTVPPSPPRSPPLRPFLWRLFKSTNTQRRSRHSTDTVSEFHAEAPQATASEGLAHGSYVAARVGVEPATLQSTDIDSTNEPPRPKICSGFPQMPLTLLSFWVN